IAVAWIESMPTPRTPVENQSRQLPTRPGLSDQRCGIDEGVRAGGLAHPQSDADWFRSEIVALAAKSLHRADQARRPQVLIAGQEPQGITHQHARAATGSGMS